MKFTRELVAAQLGMGNPKSAADVVGAMRRLGLITEEGTLTDRGHKWRTDERYAEACQEILDEVYPGELSAFSPEQGETRVPLVRWFEHQGFGKSNAGQMAATYATIASKTVPEVRAAKGPKQKPTTARPSHPSAKAQSASQSAADGSDRPVVVASVAETPRLHLDIQIHIPADASVAQIDAIFASMAKHLYTSG
jgi:hypothetical protein